MTTPRFVDLSGAPHTDPELWEPVTFTAAEISAEIERLASEPQPANGRRESAFVHPRSTEPGLGLAPGIAVKLSVLLPGEQTVPVRQNSTQLDFCIRGEGRSLVGDRVVRYSQYDAFNIPSYRVYQHFNDSDDLLVRLSYSNAPLLEKMYVHFVEENPVEAPVAASDEAGEDAPENHSPYGILDIGGGAKLMPYELLISPPSVESPALHWPWKDVNRHLEELAALGETYRGRRLYLLYNDMTGRTNGTTPSFFSTITIRPAEIVDRPHRHVSAAINYYFAGHGYSRVAGRKYEWSAGDLMLSAPGWAIHNHASGSERVYEMTIQDQPLNIAMESLLWQEDLKHPARLLGATAGFDTNRSQVGSR